MKKMMFFLFLLVGLVASAAPIKVDERVQKLFAEAFPAARSVTWYTTETHYQVVFLNDEVQCRITYRLDGTVERTERYYTESDLPPFVLSKIKSRYAAYKIHGVTEIATELGVVYHLVLEGEKKWLEVESDETGRAFVNRRFNRQAAPVTVKSF